MVRDEEEEAKEAEKKEREDKRETESMLFLKPVKKVFQEEHMSFNRSCCCLIHIIWILLF